MRCDCCPLSNPEDTCPEAEGEYGIEHKDGVCGCRHPWNWAYKREMMYANALGEMGLDRGIEMDFATEVTFYPQMFVDGVVDFEIGD